MTNSGRDFCREVWACCTPGPGTRRIVHAAFLDCGRLISRTAWSYATKLHRNTHTYVASVSVKPARTTPRRSRDKSPAVKNAVNNLSPCAVNQGCNKPPYPLVELAFFLGVFENFEVDFGGAPFLTPISSENDQNRSEKR